MYRSALSPNVRSLDVLLSLVVWRAPREVILDGCGVGCFGGEDLVLRFFLIASCKRHVTVETSFCMCECYLLYT